MARSPWGGPRLRRCSVARGSLIGVALAGLLLAGHGVAVAGEDHEATVRVRSTQDGSARRATGQRGSDEVVTESGDGVWYQVAERERPAPSPSVTAGDRIVAVAIQYLGYPYAWAGNTPAGFDCAGFTQFVVLQALGVDVGHGLGGQPAAGAWVEWGAWQPGDLVFFQNTYQPGLSHVGIYVGDGLFIHAENEETGVVLSSILSDYYGPRYWGAVRIG